RLCLSPIRIQRSTHAKPWSWLRSDRRGIALTALSALRYWNMARQRHCRRLARNGKPGASLLTPSSNQLPRPARKAGFSTFESRSGRETDSPLEGSGFEPSVPPEARPLGKLWNPEPTGGRVGRLTSNPGGIIDAPAH